MKMSLIETISPLITHSISPGLVENAQFNFNALLEYDLKYSRWLDSMSMQIR